MFITVITAHHYSFINEDRSVNFSRSSYLSLDRNASINYTLPDDLTPGLYRVFAYDIKRYEMLFKGDQFTITAR